MVQEHYTTMRANGWTPAVVDSLTLRQYVYGWAMVKIWDDRELVQMAVAARNSNPGVKDTDFQKWLNTKTGQ